MIRTVSLKAAVLMTSALAAGLFCTQADAQAVNLTPPAQTGDAVPATPQPDKSSYNLFNPTPDAQERSFNTDRPNKSNSPYTVDAGHFQIETDLFGIQSDHYSAGHTQTQQIFTADPTFKMGLTNTIDFEVALGGYQTVRVKQGAGPATVYDGFGDVTLRTKVNMWGNESGTTAFALIPYLKIPTASAGLGNNQVEGGIIAPLSITLPYDFTAVLETEVDVLKNAADSGKHGSFVNVINVSHPITPKLTGSVEFYSQIQSAENPDIYTADVALAYLVGPNTQLDTAVYAGLNRAAPDVVGYVGLSQRF